MQKPSTQTVSAAGNLALASLGLPISLFLASGLGAALMVLAGCQRLPHSLGLTGGSVAVLSLGGLASSMIGNILRSRRSRRLAEQASIEVEDDERLHVVAQLADKLQVPVPTLRAIAHELPLAFGILDRSPSIIVSTWTFDQLTEDEWRAVVAHELAHMRQRDRFYRWLGSSLLKTVTGLPGSRQAWSQLDAAMEQAADKVAIALLGDDEALRSARQKFHAAMGTPMPPQLSNALNAPSVSRQLAIVGLGVVATLPLVPFVIVPLCMWVCSL